MSADWQALGVAGPLKVTQPPSLTFLARASFFC